jgi:outer membrane protein OmpA-like peptidoglycan-associated protein
MKTRTLITLLLSTLIALPAFAQQANSGSSAQSAASATQTTPASPGVTATGEAPLTWTREDFWDGDEPGFAALVLHTFASKGYVQRQTVPIRDRLNDLEQIATAHGDKMKAIDGRTQQGVQLASTKTNEGDQHALDASNKAQMAQQAAGAVDTHLSKVEPVVANIDQYKADAETVIRFRPGQTVLSKDAKSALDEMASPLKDQHGYVIEVQGFSSGQGQAAIAASRRMADSVARYLILNHEVPAYRIYTVGMGNAPAAGAVGTAAKHKGSSRVAISVLRNGPAQMASTPSSGAPPK